MKKLSVVIAILLGVHLLFLLAVRLLLENVLSKAIGKHPDQVQIEYKSTHVDFFLRFIEIEGIQVIPKKQELGIFSIASVRVGDWGWKNGHLTASVALQNVRVASDGTLKNIRELLGCQDDALDTHAKLLLAYDYKHQQALATYQQDTPRLGFLKLSTVLEHVSPNAQARKTATVDSIDLHYTEESLLTRTIELLAMQAQMTPAAFVQDFTARLPEYMNLIPGERLKTLVQSAAPSSNKIQPFLLKPGELHMSLRPKLGNTLLLQDLLVDGLDKVAPQLEARIILMAK